MHPDMARLRSETFRLTRAFFSLQGYAEVDTPVLCPALIPESAIEVFETWFLPPDKDPVPFYLNPSPELWMKKLLADGWPSIFQITKSFRNAESIGAFHNPEFTLLEYYTREAGYLDSITVTESYFAYLIENLSPYLRVPDLSPLRPPFKRLRLDDAFQEFAGFSLERSGREELFEQAQKIGLPVSAEDSWESLFNQIFVHQVEPQIPKDRPVVLLDYPAEVRCLAKRIPGTPWRERWELYVGGIELANCFTEEDDPEEVAAHFEEEGRRKQSAQVPHRLDLSFRDMFGKPFPRCSGVALGMDRLIMALSGTRSIEGVIFFPASGIL